MFPKTVKSTLVGLLRDEIVRGTYPPGSRLRLEELAQRFGVSVIPIREALGSLEAEGLVVSQPQRGARVTSYTAAEMRELYEIRAMLERFATTRAVPNLIAPDFEALQRLVQEMAQYEGNFDVAPFTQLNHAFHRVIYDRAGMPHLAALIRDQRYRVQHYLYKHLQATDYSLSGNRQHQRLLDLARTGEADAAGVEMYHHILDTGLQIAEVMAQEETGQDLLKRAKASDQTHLAD